jgi:hypothetical protein
MKHENLIESLTENLKPVQPFPSVTNRFLRLMFLAAVVVGLGILYWYMKKNEAHFPAGRSFVEFLLLLLTVLSAGFFATRSVSPHWATAKIKKVPVLLFSLWTLLLVSAFAVGYAQTPSDALVALQYNTWLCPTVIVSIMLPMGLTSWLYLKKGSVLFPKTTFLYWSVMMVSLGALGLGFICPWTDPLHEILWHVLPSALLILIATVVGKSLFQIVRRYNP